MPSARRLPLDRRALWVLGILGGLGVRVALIGEMGTNDMNTYFAWGKGVAISGLAATYEGIYYPLQYEIFRISYGAAGVLGISEVEALKIGNLVCDIGIFVLLLLLLRRLELPLRYALVYWLHPFFLAISWLGYVDMQVGVLLVLTLLAVSYSTRAWHYLVAGLPLGAMFVMKPQGATFVYVLILAGGLAFVGHRRGVISPTGMALARRVPLLLVGPALLFGAFSLALASEGSSTSLVSTYSPGMLASQSAGLNDNLPNIWFPVADALRRPGEPVYAVTHPSALNVVADVLTAALLVAVCLLVLRRRDRSVASLMLGLLGMTAVVWPMTLTHVHENHLYYGSLLAIVLIPIVRRRWLTLGIQGLLLLQFVNLAGRYGFGLNHLTSDQPMRWFVDAYLSDWLRLTVAYLAIACFVVVLTSFARWALSDRRPSTVESGTVPLLPEPVRTESA